MQAEKSRVRLLSAGTAREMLAIVASILIAFAVDAGWDDRQERVLETEVLADLVEEAEANLAALEESTASQRTRVDQLRILLADLEAPQSALGVDSLSGLQRVYFASRFRPRTGVMRELIASGDMRVVRSRELRKRLAGFEEAIAPYLANSAAISDRNLDPWRDPVGPDQWVQRPLSSNAREVANYLRWVQGMTVLVVAQSQTVVDELNAIRELAGGT